MRSSAIARQPADPRSHPQRASGVHQTSAVIAGAASGTRGVPSAGKLAERGMGAGEMPTPARITCKCGTIMIFPPQVSTRTCWNCGTVLKIPLATEAQPPLPPPSAPPPLPPPSLPPTQTMVAAAALPGLKAAALAEKQQASHELPPPAARPHPGMPSKAEAVHHTSEDKQLEGWVCGLLLISLIINGAFMVMWQGGLPMMPAGLGESLGLDTDGDGIPDHHDFCPRGSLLKPGLKGWISGRATDFDGDGCEDKTEDFDVDNDGVNNTEDGCPFTPQRYAFLSNSISDFDGDGCADGVEDHDDDGDQVLNADDHCPRTLLGHISDKSGCSRLQREEEAKGKGSCLSSQWEVASRFYTQAAADQSAKDKEKGGRSLQEVWDEWFQLIRSAWVEVLLGAALTSILGQATELSGTLQQQLTTTKPLDSVQRLSGQALGAASRNRAAFTKLAVRTMFYMLFFLCVYGYRALQRWKLPQGFPF